MEQFYLMGIKINGKLVFVQSEPISLLEAIKVKNELDTNNTKYVILRCCEIDEG